MSVMNYDPSKAAPLTIPEAIGREEGWNLIPAARCKRNNNPGNLNFEQWEVSFGAALETVPAGETARFAVFPNPQAGFAALVHLCGFPKYKGKSLTNLIEAWAPPTDNNNTSLYLSNVCKWTGLTPETIIDSHLGL